MIGETNIKGLDFNSNIDYSKLPEYACALPSFWRNGTNIETTAYVAYINKFVEREEYEHFALWGKSYFEIAYFLLSTCIENNSEHQADEWISPIFFNITHGIELYLKAIIVCFHICENGENKETERGRHSLKEYYSLLEAQYQKILEKDILPRDYDECIKIVKNFIDNIYEKTDDMTFSRYPTTANHSYHFYLCTPSNVTVDISILQKQVLLIYKMLDYLFWRTKEIIDSNSC